MNCFEICVLIVLIFWLGGFFVFVLMRMMMREGVEVRGLRCLFVVRFLFVELIWLVLRVIISGIGCVFSV